MNCLDYENHKIIEDPDPYDEYEKCKNDFEYFVSKYVYVERVNDDCDIAVVRTKEKNKNLVSDAIWNFFQK